MDIILLTTNKLKKLKVATKKEDTQENLLMNNYGLK